MKFIVDIDDSNKQELINMTAMLNIHGNLGKKQIVSHIGKQCATKIVNACFSYLKAFKD